MASPENKNYLQIPDNKLLIPGSSNEVLRTGLEVREVARDIAWDVDANRLFEQAHPNWDAEITALAKEAPEKTIRGGSIATSYESPDFITRYHPTNGLKIKERLPWLVDLYQGPFRETISALMKDDSLKLGSELAHALNMNLTLAGPYELHPDRNPGTVLAAVNTLRPHEGGVTTLWKDRERSALIAKWMPRKGHILVFKGHYPHEVTAFTPETPDRNRITVPGDYYNNEFPEPEEVDHDFLGKIGITVI